MTANPFAASLRSFPTSASTLSSHAAGKRPEVILSTPPSGDIPFGSISEDITETILEASHRAQAKHEELQRECEERLTKERDEARHHAENLMAQLRTARQSPRVL